MHRSVIYSTGMLYRLITTYSNYWWIIDSTPNEFETEEGPRTETYLSSILLSTPEVIATQAAKILDQDHHDKYCNHTHNCTDNGCFSITTAITGTWLLLNWEQLIGKSLSCSIVKSVKIFLHQCC